MEWLVTQTPMKTCHLTPSYQQGQILASVKPSTLIFFTKAFLPLPCHHQSCSSSICWSSGVYFYIPCSIHFWFIPRLSTTLHLLTSTTCWLSQLSIENIAWLQSKFWYYWLMGPYQLIDLSSRLDYIPKLHQLVAMAPYLIHEYLINHISKRRSPSFSCNPLTSSGNLHFYWIAVEADVLILHTWYIWTAEIIDLLAIWTNIVIDILYSWYIWPNTVPDLLYTWWSWGDIIPGFLWVWKVLIFCA